jgi:Gene product 88
VTTITINHARAESSVLAFWDEDTTLTYTLPMNARLAHMIAGSMGFPSKMPGTAYGIPAQECRVGSKLAQILGTTCHDCYALKGNYIYGDVKRAQYIRLVGTRHMRWAESMAFMLNAMHGFAPMPRGLKRKRVKSKGWHRWHDAGDIQSVAHLAAICRVCELTPRIRHWLPTREIQILLAFTNTGGKIPSNLVVRVSATKVDGGATTQWPTTSGVYDKLAPRGKRCSAPDTNNECGNCRACWSLDVPHVDYHKH